MKGTRLRVKGSKGLRGESQKTGVEESRSRGVEKTPSTGHKSQASSQPTAHRAPRTASPPTAHNPQPTTLRLFYALKVPADIAAKLAEAQRQLKGNWRAVNPSQMHVTLSYLPSVPPARVDDLKRLGTRLVRELGPLEVSLRGTGYFPNEGSPRVWFVKVEADGLTELAQAFRAGMQELGLETDDVNFKAHITLARKKGPAPRVPPLTFELGWTAGSVGLYRSILRKTGPIYEVESTFRFRGHSLGRGASPPAALPPSPHPTPHDPQPPSSQESS